SNVDTCTTAGCVFIVRRGSGQGDAIDRVNHRSASGVIEGAGRVGGIFTNFKCRGSKPDRIGAAALQSVLQTLCFKAADYDVAQVQASSDLDGDLVVVTGTTSGNSSVATIQHGAANVNYNILSRPASRIVVNLTENGLATQSQLDGAIGSGSAHIRTSESQFWQLHNSGVGVFTKNLVSQNHRGSNAQVYGSCSRTKRHRR